MRRLCLILIIFFTFACYNVNHAKHRISFEGVTSDYRPVTGEIVISFISDDPESSRNLVSEFKYSLGLMLKDIRGDKLFTPSGVFNKKSADKELERVIKKHHYGKKVIKVEFSELHLPPKVIQAIRKREEAYKNLKIARQNLIKVKRKHAETEKLYEKCFLTISSKEKDKVILSIKNSISKYISRIALLQSQKDQKAIKLKIEALKAGAEFQKTRLIRLLSLRKKSIKTRIMIDLDHVNCMKRLGLKN
ncbi:MAG: hypothetical protein GY714_30065 [Desulfobacterales bacterium]|nr:hypothetical protein [Desulfobacterales bacterium]